MSSGFLLFLKKICITIVFLFSGVDYYFLSLFIASLYDTRNKLVGAPASMLVALGAGPIIALSLWIITSIILYWCLKKKYNVASSIIVVTHLLVLLGLFIFFSTVLVKHHLA